MKKNLFTTERIPRTTFELISSFLSEKKIAGKSEKTIESYKNAFHVIGLSVDFHIPATSITKKDIEKFIDGCKERNLSEHSIAHYIRHFKAFLNGCVDERYSAVKVSGYSTPERFGS